MHYNFLNLDEKIREIMIDEVNQDLSNNNFYESRSMNEFGLTTYPNILKTHFKTGDVNSLAAALSSNMFLSTDSAGRKTRYNINKVVAYNDFNKYYVRAILRLATEDKYLGVEIYRAKYSSKPRN